MKRIFEHPAAPTTGKKYWRGLGELEDTPEFRGWVEREFPQGASELSGGEVSRRNFLQLMSASLALAGLSFAGCRRPEKHLVPFTRGVEWSIPGKALFFATAMPTRRGYMPLVATTYDGRPTKIEGNPLHPTTKGATDTWAQSSILDLYDPDRARTFRLGDQVKTSADFEAALDDVIGKAGDGAGLAFLLERDSSPTRERLRAEIETKFPKSLWAVYEPLEDGAADEAAAAAFGPGLILTPQLAAANVILTLDADVLGLDGTIADQRAFALRRRPDAEVPMNRLYAVENRFTITGGSADHRLRVPASRIGAFALDLAAEIATQTKDEALSSFVAAAPRNAAKFKADWIKFAAEDLIANRGAGLILVGARQPAVVQALGLAINAALGNLGKTLLARKGTEKPAISLAELTKEMDDKKITTLVVVGGNPAYNAPSDLEFLARLKAVPTVLRVSAYDDETSEAAMWQAPLAHYLESWGDGRGFDGSYLAVQPMIMPLFGGWSELDVLAKFAGRPKPTGPELVQETFQKVAAPADFTASWAKFLRDGFLPESTPAAAPLAFNAATVAALASDDFPMASFDAETFEIVFPGDAKLDDGRYANNGWLQELPDPITKLTWDNAACISPASARKLGVKDGARVEIKIENRAVDVPVLIVPGHADGSITLPLGYGRTKAGRVGNVGQTTEGYVLDREMTSGGFNAYPLRTTREPYFIVGVQVRPTGASYKLAVTQEHGTLEGRGPDLTREGSLDEYKAKPDFAKKMGMDAHAPAAASLYAHPVLDNIHQWGMAVDLNTCTGCSACMLACQAENNVPIVGKRQVIDGREMHWLRMDRYFASMDEHDEEPEMVSQPMMCQHCENAPCETVCPVNATVHSDDGLNVMAYNRCIGTRYCANNCPFKVRRFNFFDYNRRKLDSLRTWNLISEKGTEDTIKMSKNPNVTVRMRGVMEKCTFCVQRIQEAKVAAKVAARDSDEIRLPADSFTVACAQACPTDSLVFGDVNNPESRVAKLKKSERGYRLLEYLNVNTRMWYLARIRNPNPKMPGAEMSGKAIKSSPDSQHHGVAHPEPHSEHSDAPEAALSTHAGGPA